MHCEAYGTAQWSHAQGICPIFSRRSGLKCIGIRQVWSLTGVEPGYSWILCFTRSKFPMSRSSSEMTFENLRSNCANVAWKLSFNTGLAWWMMLFEVIHGGDCGVLLFCLNDYNVLGERVVLQNVPNVEPLQIFWSSPGLMILAGMASSWNSERVLKAKTFCSSHKDCEVLKIPCFVSKVWSSRSDLPRIIASYAESMKDVSLATNLMTGLF